MQVQSALLVNTGHKESSSKMAALANLMVVLILLLLELLSFEARVQRHRSEFLPLTAARFGGMTFVIKTLSLNKLYPTSFTQLAYPTVQQFFPKV